MKTVKGLSRREFDKRFGSEQQCIEYLIELKWGNGFQCVKCFQKVGYRGKYAKNMRCKSCGYEESPTANTLFHKLKFDLSKAFGMIYDVLLSKKGANSIWLSERYEVSQNTAWLFRMKLINYLGSSGKNPLTNEVHVDEFEIGTPKKGQQGRSKSDEKDRIIIACEIRGSKVGRAYAREIKDFSASELEPIFEKHIDKQAFVTTDLWRGYLPIKKKYPNMTQIESEKGANFPEIHIQIRNLKNWLRGVHSYCSTKYLQCYLDEYFFRFNRRNSRKSIIPNLFNRLIMLKSYNFKEIRANAI